MTRTYDDGCGIAHALDLVGERWALLVVRELLLGPKRFTDLRAGLPGVSANILSQRLRELEAEGIVERATLPPPAGVAVYALTPRGAELEPVVLALGAWGVRSPTLPRDAHLGVDSVILSLAAQLTHTDPPATYELRLDQYRFTVRLHDGRVDVARGRGRRTRTPPSRPPRARSTRSCPATARWPTSSMPERRASTATWTQRTASPRTSPHGREV